MRLVSAVLGFLLRKVGLLALIALTLFGGYLLVHTLVPALREAVTDRERLQQVAAERAALEEDLEQLRAAAAEEQAKALESLEDTVEAEIEEGRDTVADKKAELERLRDEEKEFCSTVEKVIAILLPGNACKSAERAAQKADEALTTLEDNLARAEEDAAVLSDPDLTSQEKYDRLLSGGEPSPTERQIDNTESAIDQKEAEEKSLADAQSAGAGWLVDQWAKSWRWLVFAAALIVLGPYLMRTFNYFVLMPLVTRAHKCIRLADGSDEDTADIRPSPAVRTLTIDLGPGEVLSARSEHVRPVQGTARSRVLYDWSSPFISFAAGLYALTRATGDEEGTSATLATPDDPDSYLMRIDFTDHPGLVVHPKHVVGVIGTPRLETRWRWGILAFAAWQVRYIMFAGTGSLIVQGSGDVVATNPHGRSTRMEQHLVMGFDSRLTVGVNRTEVFLSYLRGKTPLVDDEFSGHHPLLWQKSTTEGSRNPVTKAFDAFFSAIGKVFGF